MFLTWTYVFLLTMSQDLSVLNLSTGLDVLKQSFQDRFQKQESAIILEIKKIRICQSDQLVGPESLPVMPLRC